MIQYVMQSEMMELENKIDCPFVCRSLFYVIFFILSSCLPTVLCFFLCLFLLFGISFFFLFSVLNLLCICVCVSLLVVGSLVPSPERRLGMSDVPLLPGILDCHLISSSFVFIACHFFTELSCSFCLVICLLMVHSPFLQVTL